MGCVELPDPSTPLVVDPITGVLHIWPVRACPLRMRLLISLGGSCSDYVSQTPEPGRVGSGSRSHVSQERPCWAASAGTVAVWGYESSVVTVHSQRLASQAFTMSASSRGLFQCLELTQGLVQFLLKLTKNSHRFLLQLDFLVCLSLSEE